MNQKNIFTVIAALMLLQGAGVFLMSTQIATDAFPGLSSKGIWAASEMATVAAVLMFGLGLITFFVRDVPAILPAYIFTFLLLVMNTSKHIFISGVAVPLPLYILQILFLLAFIVLFVQHKKSAMTTGKQAA